MRHYLLNCFAVLLGLIWQTAIPCYAAPAIKTAPHIFPLHFVSWINKDLIVPRIALKANFVAYPDVPSYKQFLDAAEDSPERTVARYLQQLSIDSPSSEVRNAAKKFYTEEEQKDSEYAINRLLERDYRQVKRFPEARLWHRYDAGSLSIISLAYISPERAQPFVTLYLRKSGPSYFITSYGSGYRKEEQSSPLRQIIDLNESNLVSRPNLDEVDQPNYTYHLPLSSPIPGTNQLDSSMQVLFTGQVSDIVVDQEMIPANPTQAFVKHAIETLRTGTLQEFLSLWTERDRKGVLAQNLALQATPNTAYRPPTRIGRREWNRVQPHIVFTIDCGVESVVFLRASDSEELIWIVIWKESPGNYQLSETGKLSTNETTFPGNLTYLFDSPKFQSYLNAQIDQFIEQTGAKTDDNAIAKNGQTAAKVSLGERAPDFKVVDMNGNPQNLADYKGKSNVLLTFFPRCFTGGCANHLSSLRDQQKEFDAANTQILAVSVDPAEGEKGQLAFAKQWNLEFPLIPDTTHQLGEQFGAMNPGDERAARMTFLIDKQGIVRTIDTGVNVQTHGADMIAKIRELGLDR